MDGWLEYRSGLAFSSGINGQNRGQDILTTNYKWLIEFLF
jgi:hypothetical protein